MQLHQASGDGETQARASVTRANVRSLGILLEDAGEPVRCDAHARIGDAKSDRDDSVPAGSQ